MVSGLGYRRVNMDYQLGRDDCVIGVCSAWSTLARERMALALDEEMVLGRSLWEFVHGGATQRLYDALLHHVRATGQKIQFAYRGDSPSTIRYMRMSLLPGPHHLVRFRSEILHEQSRQRNVYFTHVAYPRHPDIMQCSLCQKIEFNGRWYTVAEALAHTDAIDDLLPTEVGDTVCESCLIKTEFATGCRL